MLRIFFLTFVEFIYQYHFLYVCSAVYSISYHTQGLENRNRGFVTANLAASKVGVVMDVVVVDVVVVDVVVVVFVVIVVVLLLLLCDCGCCCFFSYCR